MVGFFNCLLHCLCISDKRLSYLKVPCRCVSVDSFDGILIHLHYCCFSHSYHTVLSVLCIIKKRSDADNAAAHQNSLKV